MGHPSLHYTFDAVTPSLTIPGKLDSADLSAIQSQAEVLPAGVNLRVSLGGSEETVDSVTLGGLIMLRSSLDKVGSTLYLEVLDQQNARIIQIANLQKFFKVEF
uniref:STAS domain-containing protein n=1 Tax=Magnetococcus massalia (strain MO-1) TaxID=451514 RepID=A0A1S7LCT3_MAGMO|nr:protein of unknown function [Candidatus Magnetococcus massalia]